MLDNANTLSRDNVLARNGNGDTGGLAYNAGRFLTRRHLMEFFIFMTVLILDILVGVFAASRGRSGIGFFLIALVLSPLIGFIIVLVMKPNAKVVESRSVESGELRKCPYCAELVKPEAIICKHCGSKLLAIPEKEEIYHAVNDRDRQEPDRVFKIVTLSSESLNKFLVFETKKNESELIEYLRSREFLPGFSMKKELVFSNDIELEIVSDNTAKNNKDFIRFSAILKKESEGFSYIGSNRGTPTDKRKNTTPSNAD